ncbi:putative membrane protein [Escherichia coli 5-366-08_S1_C1]|nr:putative membrane protein [Escherichia coli 5-366-08_S1_C3]KEL67184.1 putative membrane protein [Escherichia coli 5-366-08_S1_C1]
MKEHKMIFYFIYIRNIFCFLLVMFTLTPDKNALYITQMAA